MRAKLFLAAASAAAFVTMAAGCMPNVPRIRNPEALRYKPVYAEVIGEDSEDFQRSLKELASDNPELSVVDQKGEIVVRMTVTAKKKWDTAQKWNCSYGAKFEAADSKGKSFSSGQKNVEFESPAEPIVCSAARMHLWAAILGQVSEDYGVHARPRPRSAEKPADTSDIVKPDEPKLQLQPPKILQEGGGN
jgi:hypothetical protein